MCITVTGLFLSHNPALELLSNSRGIAASDRPMSSGIATELYTCYLVKFTEELSRMDSAQFGSCGASRIFDDKTTPHGVMQDPRRYPHDAPCPERNWTTFYANKTLPSMHAR